MKGARLRVEVVSTLRRRLNQCDEAMLSYSPVPGKDGEVHDVQVERGAVAGSPQAAQGTQRAASRNHPRNGG